ncbi:hypothetical protein ACLOJK_013202, partial [Asimina triloba]
MLLPGAQREKDVEWTGTRSTKNGDGNWSRLRGQGKNLPRRDASLAHVSNVLASHRPINPNLSPRKYETNALASLQSHAHHHFCSP